MLAVADYRRPPISLPAARGGPWLRIIPILLLINIRSADRFQRTGRAGWEECQTAAADFRRRFGDYPAADLSAAIVSDW